MIDLISIGGVLFAVLLAVFAYEYQRWREKSARTSKPIKVNTEEGALEPIGVDFTTRGTDEDILLPEKSRLLRIQLNRIWLVIQDMERIAGNVNEEDLFANLLGEYGIRRAEASRLISILMRDGKIYSPNPGYYKKTSSAMSTSSAKGSEKVVVSPQRASVGDPIRVYSDSHTAGEVVQIYFDFVQSESILSEVVARNDGVIEQVVTIPEAEIGIHYLWVKDLATGISERASIQII